MRALLCELDGTTQIYELANPAPVIYLPMFSRTSPVEASLADDCSMRAAEYKLANVSDDIAFYDRVVNVEEIR